MKIKIFFITLTCLFLPGLSINAQFMMAEGTRITMADDTEKNIEKVKAGDILLAFNNIDKVYEDKKVKSVNKVMLSRFVRITLETGMQLTLTGDSPIWAERGWVSVDPEWTKVSNDKYVNIKPCTIGEFVLFYNVTTTDYVEISIIQGIVEPTMAYEIELEGGGTLIANGFLIGHN